MAHTCQTLSCGCVWIQQTGVTSAGVSEEDGGEKPTSVIQSGVSCGNLTVSHELFSTCTSILLCVRERERRVLDENGLPSYSDGW